MAYETGTATGVVDLAGKLNTFLINRGWVVDRFDNQGTGKRLQFHKGTSYFSTRWFNNEFGAAPASGANLYGPALIPCTGYASGSDWNAQPGAVTAVSVSTKLGVALPLSAGAIVAYFFFSDATDDNFFVVVLRSGTIYNFLGFGTSLEKYGAWTGGQWCTGTKGAANFNIANGTDAQGAVSDACPPGFNLSVTEPTLFCLVDIDGINGKFQGLTNSTATFEKTDRFIRGCICQVTPNQNTPETWDLGMLAVRSFNPISSGLVLLPCFLTIERTTGLYSPLGKIPLAFQCYNQLGGFPFGEEFTIGSDTYVAFPTYAIKKIV